MKRQNVLILILFVLLVFFLIVNIASHKIFEKALNIDTPEKMNAATGALPRPRVKLVLPKMASGPYGKEITKTPSPFSSQKDMPPAKADDVKVAFKNQLGLDLAIPKGVEVRFGQYENGRMIQADMFFKDAPRMGAAFYGYKGRANEAEVQKFVLEETGTVAQDWEEVKNLGNLKENGFAVERSFQMRNEEQNNSKFLIYAKGPGDKHFVFMVYGNGDSIDQKMDSLKSIYNSLKVSK